MSKRFIIPLFLLFLTCSSSVFAQCADPLTDKCGRATGFVDVDFGVDDFSGNEVLIDSFCAYTQADGDGRARIRNTGASTQFTADNRRYAVVDGLGNEIQTRVHIRGTVDTTWRQIRADQGYTNRVRDVGEHPTENELCGIGGDTNDIRTQIQRGWINGAIPGVYNGFIELQMSPD
ncbi:MAG: hypothetical protein OSB62_07155 [Alphaproteobacteria bacterium]|nr:hypothetical protein [Alphaproteobacteria bacterium]